MVTRTPTFGGSPTRKEMQTLMHVAMGATNGQAARLLHVTEDTVKTNLHRLFVKIGAKSRAHAVAIAFQRNLWELAR